MYKRKTAQLKAAMPSEGMVEGYAATFDREPDSYGDIIKPGAFARTLREWESKAAEGLSIPLLFAHDTYEPTHNIGKVVEAYEDAKGLFIRAEFDADNETAQYARKLVQEGRLSKFSFAYGIKDAGEIKENGRWAFELRDLDLYEVSLVQIPANQNAVVTGIKSGKRNSKADADELRGIRESAESIITAINGLLADDDEPDDNDGGPDPKANDEAGNGKSEEPEVKETGDNAELEAAMAYAKSLLDALEVM